MQGTESQDTTRDHWETQGPPSDFSDATFARWLRAAREASGLTQQQLADAMASTGNRIHRSTIGKIESGDRPVSIGEAIQLASFLGVPPAEMVSMVSDTVGERKFLQATEVMIRVRALEHEEAERKKALVNAQVLHGDTVNRLHAAREELRALTRGDDQ